MRALKKFWLRVKRNPVLVGFGAALAAQLFHDYQANEIDWTNFSGYVATLFIGVAVREFTVPLKEHEEKMDSALNEIARKGSPNDN